jgi:hypothetical protein
LPPRVCTTAFPGIPDSRPLSVFDSGIMSNGH